MKLQELQKAESYLYAERYINQFKKVANKVSPQYCAVQGKSSFFLPYWTISRNKVQVFLAHPNPKIYQKIIFDGKVNFFVHPETLQEMPLGKPDSKIRVAPTSSTRTVLLPNKSFALKLHLNKRLSKYIRRLRPSSIQHSVLVSLELEKALKTCPRSFGYLPESIGIAYQRIGMIVREMTPRPIIKEKRILFPLFSLYSKDLKHEQDEPLFIQLITRNRRDPPDFFLNDIIRPLFQNMSYFICEYGILLEPHGQNVLVEMDYNLNITRLIHRDFQSIYIDKEIRNQKNLPVPFKKHLMGVECPKEISYSLVYDQFVGKYLFDPFIELIATHYKISQKIIKKEIKKLFAVYFDKNLFPKEGYYLMKKGTFKDNDTIYKKYHQKPKYRP